PRPARSRWGRHARRTEQEPPNKTVRMPHPGGSHEPCSQSVRPPTVVVRPPRLLKGGMPAFLPVLRRVGRQGGFVVVCHPTCTQRRPNSERLACAAKNDLRELLVTNRKISRLGMAALGVTAAVASLTLTTPAQASTQSAALVVYSCKYDANVRYNPYIRPDNIAYTCRKGTTIYPDCYLYIGDTVNGSKLWYSLRNRHDGTGFWIHSSQVSQSGSGGLGRC
ncbi:hypothetical protein, partial [Nonomuraea sp. NPDC050310]|uniref:hypothetical protein n=1 Tax=Nonomuraea sp. NPDC050310 TaxID=3154935 RepID=UPI0033D46E2E